MDMLFPVRSASVSGFSRWGKCGEWHGALRRRSQSVALGVEEDEALIMLDEENDVEETSSPTWMAGVNSLWTRRHESFHLKDEHRDTK